LDIQLSKQSDTEALIKVKLTQADYQHKIDQKLKDYRKKVSLNGFRPGKVPTSLIKKMYGKSLLFEEVNQLLSESLQKYIKDENLNLIGDPLIDDEKVKDINWEEQEDFEFEYEVGLVPDFVIDSNIEVTKYEIQVGEAQLNESLANLQDSYAGHQSPDESQLGDIFFGELEKSESGFKKSAILYTDKVEEKYQGDMQGVKKEDILTFDIQKLFSDEADLSSFVGSQNEDNPEVLEGEFTFKVNDISRKVHAKMDQDLFDRVFGKDTVKTEEEFMEKLKSVLEDSFKKESQNLFARDLQKKLLETTNVELSEDFYKKWLLKTNDKLSEEELSKDFEHYIRDLKWQKIKSKVLAENDLKVEQDEVIQKTKQMFRIQSGISETSSPEIENYLDQLANNYLQNENYRGYFQVYDAVLTDKVIDVLKGQVKVVVEKVSKEDFEKQIEKQ